MCTTTGMFSVKHASTNGVQFWWDFMWSTTSGLNVSSTLTVSRSEQAHATCRGVSPSLSISIRMDGFFVARNFTNSARPVKADAICNAVRPFPPLVALAVKVILSQVTRNSISSNDNWSLQHAACNGVYPSRSGIPSDDRQDSIRYLITSRDVFSQHARKKGVLPLLFLTLSTDFSLSTKSIRLSNDCCLAHARWSGVLPLAVVISSLLSFCETR